MNIELGVAFRDAEKFIYERPLLCGKHQRGVTDGLQIDPFDKRKAAFAIDWKRLPQVDFCWAELLIVATRVVSVLLNAD